VRGSEAVRLIQFSLKCEFAHCGEVHNSKVKLLQHYKIAHRKEKKPCIFEDCDTTVDLFSSLVKHIKKKHDGKNHALKKQIVCNSDSGSLSSLSFQLKARILTRKVVLMMRNRAQS